MKSIWTGFCVAFSLYSAIPVPQVAWEKKTMRWALSFLPLVGVLVGGAELLWFWFCRSFGASALLYAILAGLLPLVITGGIHMDGLTDTCDALCSFGEKEKKLEILKDPHVGAFGPMWLMAFLLAQTALFAQLYETPALLPLAALAFPLARALGAAQDRHHDLCQEHRPGAPVCRGQRQARGRAGDGGRDRFGRRAPADGLRPLPRVDALGAHLSGGAGRLERGAPTDVHEHFRRFDR